MLVAIISFVGSAFLLMKIEMTDAPENIVVNIKREKTSIFSGLVLIGLLFSGNQKIKNFAEGRLN